MVIKVETRTDKIFHFGDYRIVVRRDDKSARITNVIEEGVGPQLTFYHVSIVDFLNYVVHNPDTFLELLKVIREELEKEKING